MTLEEARGLGARDGGSCSRGARGRVLAVEVLVAEVPMARAFVTEALGLAFIGEEVVGAIYSSVRDGQR